MIRCSIGAVVLHRHLEDRPVRQRHRARPVAYRDVEVIRAHRLTVGERVEGQDDEEPALRGLVEVADRIGQRRPSYAGRAVDGGRVAEEPVQRHAAVDVRNRRGVRIRRQHGVATRVVDVHHVVHGLEHVPVADAERLIGRFDRELVLVVRVAILEEIQSLEAQVELGIGLGGLAADCIGPVHTSRAAAKASVDDRAVKRCGPIFSFVRGRKLGRVTQARPVFGRTGNGGPQDRQQRDDHEPDHKPSQARHSSSPCSIVEAPDGASLA